MLNKKEQYECQGSKDRAGNSFLRPVGPERGGKLLTMRARCMHASQGAERRSRERQSKKKGLSRPSRAEEYVCIIILSGAIASATGPVHTGRHG